VQSRSESESESSSRFHQSLLSMDDVDFFKMRKTRNWDRFLDAVMSCYSALLKVI